jgi:hypothetical protein
MDFPAVTFVKDYLLQLTLYRDFLDANNIKKLLAEQTGLMRKLISQNEPLEQRLNALPAIKTRSSSDPTGIDWGRVLEKAFVGGLVGALIGAIGGLFALVRRRRQH